MDLNGITFLGPTVHDTAVLDRLPTSLRTLLEQVNGFILFGGALHVRGACQTPNWHSLEQAWSGDAAFHRLYPAVKAHWIPFAEDCVGDQFFIGDGTILHLEAETGAMHETGMTLHHFLEAVQADPVKALQAEPLLQFRQEKGDLPAGQLILAYPPFCTKEAGAGVSLVALDAAHVHRFHADLANQLPSDDDKLHVKIID
jgi:hypothetical protein